MEYKVNKLLNFYMGGKDDSGRTLSEIHSMNCDEQESCHNYIQWVFPNKEKSHFNLRAPVLDQETIDAFLSSKELRNRLHNSVMWFMSFLDNNKNIWVTSIDHNHFRIHRMLKCMMCLGLEEEAKRVYAHIYEIARNDVHETFIESWKESVGV